jgi:hypothetical protein
LRDAARFAVEQENDKMPGGQRSPLAEGFAHSFVAVIPIVSFAIARSFEAFTINALNHYAEPA